MNYKKHLALKVLRSCMSYGLLAVFLFLSPCRAQDSNMEYWSRMKQVQRYRLAQATVDFNYVFLSRVVNDSTLASVSNCNIINKTQHTVTMSDVYGDFRITANVNDSISFSALGYKSLTIALSDSMFTYGHIIKLKPTVYVLKEVVIHPYIELPTISKWEIYNKPLPGQGGINLLPTEISPITFFYNLWSKEGKQLRYHQKLIEGTADFMILGEKFNGEMVSHLTGLKDDELVKFMSYCNFSNEFLLNYSPETIKREIRRKYKEYMERP